MKSSCDVPPEYCPCTSTPALRLRTRTSPSTGAASVKLCVTTSIAPACSIAAFCPARSRSARALRNVSSAVSKSFCDVACFSQSPFSRLKSRSAAARSATALLRSDENCPMSGDWITASGSPFFSFCPSSAFTDMTRPVTGEKTCETFTSAKETRPLARMVSSTSSRPIGVTVMCASLICSAVSHTWPGGAAATVGAAGAGASCWHPGMRARLLTRLATRTRRFIDGAPFRPLLRAERPRSSSS